MINAKFGILQTQCLLDTGATISCIATHFLDKIPMKFVKTLPHGSIFIQGVGGFQKQLKERVELTFTVNGRKFSEQFHSISHSYNIILGLPFMKKYKKNYFEYGKFRNYFGWSNFYIKTSIHAFKFSEIV